MTPDELRKLADEATPGPWTVDEDEPTRILDAKGYDHTYASSDADALLIAVVPELARLCAEMADVLKEIDDDPEDLSEDDIKGVLAKFSELNTGAEVPPEPERT